MFRAVQDIMGFVSRACAVVCQPLSRGELHKLIREHIPHKCQQLCNSAFSASGCLEPPDRHFHFHWQLRVWVSISPITCPPLLTVQTAQEFYLMFDGLSFSGDEAWTKGINLWPLMLCLQSIPGVFGDEDLLREW